MKSGMSVKLSTRTLASLLLVLGLATGCTKSDNQAETKPADGAEVATAQNDQAQPAESEASVQATSETAKFMSMVMVNSLKSIVHNNPDATAEQKQCINDVNEQNVYIQVDALLKKQLTDEQLKALDDFYASEVGQKLQAITNQQFRLMEGEKIENPIELTPEENKKLAEFMNSEAGKQIQQLNNGQQVADDGTQIIANEFKRCNMEVPKELS